MDRRVIFGHVDSDQHWRFSFGRGGDLVCLDVAHDGSSRVASAFLNRLSPDQHHAALPAFKRTYGASEGFPRPRYSRSRVSLKRAAASLARDRFAMSDNVPSGHRTRCISGYASSGITRAFIRSPSISIGFSGRCPSDFLSQFNALNSHVASCRSAQRFGRPLVKRIRAIAVAPSSSSARRQLHRCQSLKRRNLG